MHDQYPPDDGFYHKVVSLLETHQLFYSNALIPEESKHEFGVQPVYNRK